MSSGLWFATFFPEVTLREECNSKSSQGVTLLSFTKVPYKRGNQRKGVCFNVRRGCLEDDTENCSFYWNSFHAIDLEIAFDIQATPPFDVRSDDMPISDD